MSTEEKKIESYLPKLDKLEEKLSNWDIQFKSALESGEQVEGDLFDAMGNDFDKENW
jgi:hypothetical protein